MKTITEMLLKMRDGKESISSDNDVININKHTEKDTM